MVVQSMPYPSFILAFLLILVSFYGLFFSLLLILERNFRSGAKTLAAVAGLIGVYLLVVMTTSLLSSQKIVAIGDTFCEDIWCIGVERVDVVSRGESVEYNVAVKIFSDTGTAVISAKGASLYLLDERGRRFPLVPNPAAVPFDTTLNPGQSIQTTLTFLAPRDVRQLLLGGVHGGSLGGGELPLIPRLLVRLYLGNDGSLMHKSTLLRVL